MTVIDDYLEGLDQPQRDALERVRKVAKQVVPDVEDTIGYGMPVLKYKGKYLIGFSSFKNHLSLFPGAGPTAALKQELKTFKLSKGTIQFTLDHPVPDDLLKKIIANSLEIAKER